MCAACLSRKPAPAPSPKPRAISAAVYSEELARYIAAFAHQGAPMYATA